MSASTRLHDLLLRWEDLNKQGRPISAEELCQDCPELGRAVARADRRSAIGRSPACVGLGARPGNAESSWGDWRRTQSNAG